MTIKSENGMVTFRMRAGKDMVRNQMPPHVAKGILARAKTVDKRDGECVVDNLYYFPIETPPKRKKKENKDE